jgi:hypothetical protein
MNILRILNEPEVLQEVIKWFFEGENYKGTGAKFEDKLEDAWPTMWKSIDRFFKNAKEIAKKQLEASNIITTSNVGYEFWLNFGTYPESKDNKVKVIKNRLILKVDKNLDVVATIPTGGRVV